MSVSLCMMRENMVTDPEVIVSDIFRLSILIQELSLRLEIVELLDDMLCKVGY